jgi:glutaredoxin 2
MKKPEYTCPSIDKSVKYAMEVIKQLEELEPEYPFIYHVLRDMNELVDNLEANRRENIHLREYSDYLEEEWGLTKKELDIASKNLEGADKYIQDLKQDIESLKWDLKEGSVKTW